MISNEQRGLDAAKKAFYREMDAGLGVEAAIAAYLEATATPPLAQMLGDGEAAIIECLAAGKPFVFDPATNFLHADDGTVEYGIRYVPDDRQPAPADQMVVTGDRIADAIEACDWSGSPIGNKEILKAAVRELRSLQAWQRGAISCREAEEVRIEEYRRAATAAPEKQP